MYHIVPGSVPLHMAGQLPPETAVVLQVKFNETDARIRQIAPAAGGPHRGPRLEAELQGFLYQKAPEEAAGSGH